MPIIVRLVCDVDSLPASTDHSVIAVFRWMRSKSDDRYDSLKTDSSEQVMYPPYFIRADQFSGTPTSFDTVLLRIEPMDFTATHLHSDSTLDSAFAVTGNAYDTTSTISRTSLQARIDSWGGACTGRFSITFCDSGGRTRLAIHNLLGQEVAVLRDGMMASGSHVFRWEGTDARGLAAGTGIYFARLDAPDGVSVVELALIR